jgi:hypothetical protein
LKVRCSSVFCKLHEDNLDGKNYSMKEFMGYVQSSVF